MKSSGKPVPVKWRSSQSPLDRCTIHSQSAALREDTLADSPAATYDINAQAVCDGGAAPAPRGIRVRDDVLAESAALLLHGVEPRDGAAHRRMVVRDAACLERR